MGDNIKTEEKHISELIKTNGYPAHIIRSAQKPMGAKVEEDTLKYTMFTICLRVERRCEESVPEI